MLNPGNHLRGSQIKELQLYLIIYAHITLIKIKKNNGGKRGKELSLGLLPNIAKLELKLRFGSRIQLPHLALQWSFPLSHEPRDSDDCGGPGGLLSPRKGPGDSSGVLSKGAQ